MLGFLYLRLAQEAEPVHAKLILNEVCSHVVREAKEANAIIPAAGTKGRCSV